MARFVRRAWHSGHGGWRANRKSRKLSPIVSRHLLQTTPGQSAGSLPRRARCVRTEGRGTQPQLPERYFDVLARGVVKRPVTSRRGTGSESRCGGAESVDSADGGEVADGWSRDCLVRESVGADSAMSTQRLSITAEHANGQRTPAMTLHTGQAPQPCRARVTSAIASCSSRVARSARGA